LFETRRCESDNWLSSSRMALEDTLNSLASPLRYALVSGFEKNRTRSLILVLEVMSPENKSFKMGCLLIFLFMSSFVTHKR